MEDLHITLIQSDLYWEDPVKNIGHFSSLIDEISTPTDIIALPEMFNTGFSINPDQCAETMTGSAVNFLRDSAKKKDCLVMGSFLTSDEGLFYNRLTLAFPDGLIEKYDKRHLFRLSEEYKILKAGVTRTIVTWKEWNILPLVCYDLRFPLWSRNKWNNGRYDYDVLIYVANWPKSRSYIWKSLLVARAIENQCYVVGVNRIGKDGFGTQHSGDSMIINPDGTILESVNEERPAVIQTKLSMDKLREIRESNLFAPDWDHFEIQI